ncbi:MAG TPA: hypothetical protein VKZ67_14555 [Natronosporangium sp.]|nr:hypothetical protein [Natronosporangium sp.]
MRHLWSLLAGILVAPLAWLLLAIGQPAMQRTAHDWWAANRFDTVDLIGPTILLVVVGLVLGLLGTLRWSPLGPAVAGLLLVAPTGLMFITPLRTLEALSYDQPRRLLGQELLPAAPVYTGTLLMVGTLLLMSVVSVERWRRRERTPGLTTPAAPTTPFPGAGSLVTTGSADRGETPRPMPMSDEEILAAAAQLDEQPTADLPMVPDQPDATPNDPGGDAPDDHRHP